MFSKILIANRGEIAVRIIRACKEMGIATVAIYSQADRDALHVALADESYCVGGASPGESYLNEERVVSAALVSGAQAIHPGYGFLSENAHFAALCRKNGLVFIGPSPESMEELSDKARLKEIMGRNGLEVIPGTQVLASAQAALAAAAEIGYPVMLKASAGGGGRGIRLVSAPNEMTQAYALAVAEGEASFGDGSVYMEKYVHPARHIEVQVLADEAGNVVCLGERDCSVQRHHQKLIEESPSPAVSRSQRKKLMELTARAVKAIGCGGGDPGIPPGPGRTVLVHGDESPPPGGARGDGDADPGGPGKVADPHRRRGSAEFPAAERRPQRGLCGVPDQRPDAGDPLYAPRARRPLCPL